MKKLDITFLVIALAIVSFFIYLSVLIPSSNFLTNLGEAASYLLELGVVYLIVRWIIGKLSNRNKEATQIE